MARFLPGVDWEGCDRHTFEVPVSLEQAQAMLQKLAAIAGKPTIPIKFISHIECDCPMRSVIDMGDCDGCSPPGKQEIRLRPSGRVEQVVLHECAHIYPQHTHGHGPDFMMNQKWANEVWYGKKKAE